MREIPWVAAVVALALLRHWRGQGGFFRHEPDWLGAFIFATAVVLFVRLLVHGRSTYFRAVSGAAMHRLRGHDVRSSPPEDH